MTRHGARQKPGASAAPISKAWTVLVLSLSLACLAYQPSVADDAQEARHLVEKAALTLESFMTDPNMEVVRDLIKEARGVFIAPQVLKGAFIVGASGGSGVFLAKDASTGKWSEPAFYTLGGVSFGLQAGGEASEVVLLVMSERGVSALLSNNFKLGADASIAVGPVGAGVSGATAALSADIIAFSRAKGLYGGLSLEGSVIAVREDWNHAYYGRSVTPTDILLRRTVSNPGAATLVSAVAKAAGGK
jgi:lipid-binding SYLF domain-containing protein